jgi:hypothetical protein
MWKNRKQTNMHPYLYRYFPINLSLWNKKKIRIGIEWMGDTYLGELGAQLVKVVKVDVPHLDEQANYGQIWGKKVLGI